MKKYKITGMSCAACSARVEKAVSGLENVEACSVNLLTASMTVEGNVSDGEIKAAVEKAGYGVEQGDRKKSARRDTNNEKAGLIASVLLLAVLMYLSMGHMLNLPFAHITTANGFLQLLLSASVLIINRKFFINGTKGILHKAPNMDTLVSLGAAAAFFYSTTVLILMISDSKLGSGLYFESAAMIVTLVSVGKLLESRSKTKAANAVNSLTELAPETAVIIENGEEKSVSASSICIGDSFVVRAGAAFPADGIITEGKASVNEAMLTGESIPVDKTVTDKVYAGTVNTSGYVICRAVAVGENTGLSKIIQTVNEATSTKAPIARAADKIAGIFVPAVISIALATLVIWLLLGETVGFALARSISVLVISCPCALGLATPVAITVAGGRAARSGILFKSAAAMEETARIKTVALDKTGTVTEGIPAVTDIIPAEGISKTELLTAAASLEALSEHPLSKAVTAAAGEEKLPLTDITDYETLIGRGVKGKINGVETIGGNLAFIEESCTVPESTVKQTEELAKQGKTPLCFCKNGELIGIIAVADKIREDSAAAIAELKAMGIKTVLLTGDNSITANAVARQIGIDTVIAEVRPNGKSEAVNKLKRENKTAMVGDGINDAPALVCADIGMAIGAGTDVAIDSADVVLINNSLTDAVNAISISRKTLRNIRQNLFWAFFYNALYIPIAAGAFIPLGLTLEPMFGAAAMSLSSLFVVTNALRLNNIKSERKSKMKITMKIEGMMCPHCENRVKQTLEAIPGVEKAEVSHKKGSAEISFTSEVSYSTLKEAVENQGYKVTL